MEPKDRRELLTALISAFPNVDEMRFMIETRVDGEALHSLPAGGTPPKIFANKLITWADSRSQIPDLIQGARAENPTNQNLRRFSQGFGLEADSVGLEAFVRNNGIIHDLESFVESLYLCQSVICRVEIPFREGPSTAYGTGFLVAPSLAITNFHVVRPVAEGKASPEDVRMRFGYKRLSGGEELEGRCYGLAEKGDSWCVESSPIGELDFALLKLEGEPGNDSVLDNELTGERGFLSLGETEAADFRTGDPLIILEHPEAKPMGIAFGKVSEVDPASNVFGHDVSTSIGSSGSPCFNENWKPVGLHFGGSAKTGNRACGLKAIWKQIGHLPDLK